MNQETKKYGIGEIIEVFDAADELVGLYDAVIGDDKKVNLKDIPALLTKGPSAAKAVLAAVQGGELIPKQLTDLDEEEKQELYAKFGEKIHDIRYQKVFQGIVQIADGLTEIIQGQEN